MSNKTSRSKKKKKSSAKPLLTVGFTRRRVLVWSGIAFLAMVWMFTLGVLVGRGLSPVRFDMKKFKKELIALKERALKTDQAHFEIGQDNLSEDTELGFYQALTEKKEEARLKVAKVQRQTAKSDAKPREAHKAEKMKTYEKPEIKISEVRKERATLEKGSTRTPKAEAGQQGLLTIQVASLQDAETASQMVGLLRGKGYRARSVTVSLPGEGTYHRVRVGRFSDASETSRVAARLKREGFDTVIFRE